MTLRNAFEGLATDAMLRRIAHLVNYARTASDQMRVVVDGGSLALGAALPAGTNGIGNVGLITGSNPIGHVSLQWLNQGQYAAWYSQNAPGSMDAREQHKLAARAAANQARNDRWRYT